MEYGTLYAHQIVLIGSPLRSWIEGLRKLLLSEASGGMDIV